MQHSIPYTTKQNSAAERKNKEMATCMMESTTFPPNFLDEAIKSALYIHNTVCYRDTFSMAWGRPQ